MTPRFIRRLSISVGAAALLVASSDAVWAQEAPKIKVSGGYSLVHAYDAQAHFPAGWFASLAGDVNSWFGLAGEVSGNYRTVDVPGGPAHSSQHSLMAGPRLMLSRDGMTFFGQTLFGVARSASHGTAFGPASEMNFTVAPGGGVDVNALGRLGIHFGVNYQLLSAPNCCLSHYGRTGRELQVVTGVVFPSANWKH
jgi:hypothetical protein